MARHTPLWAQLLVLLAAPSAFAGDRIEEIAAHYRRLGRLSPGARGTQKALALLAAHGDSLEALERDWRYGIADNRKELEHVMRYTHEQGLVGRRADFREMFHPSTHST